MQTKYKKYIKNTLLFIMLSALTTTLFLTSCEKEEEESNKVVLESFGPCPIARGAELRFIGKNLDRVSEIILPDSISITDMQKSPALITLTVPQDAVEGYIILKTPEGDIVTKTQIGYSEPISIGGFSPKTIKAGAELTITGDYLNLVKEVIFTDRVVAVDTTYFTSQSRKVLKVIVPAQAQTGKIAISNGAENPIIIYADTLLNVTLPAISSLSPNPVKAGSNLTIAGTNLDLVISLTLGGDITIADSDFVSQSATSVVITMPENTKDGNVTLYPASNVAVVSSAALSMLMPTVNVTPTTLKNGADITVTGTDLDLIYKVVFGGSAEGTIKAGGSATEITVTVPDAAVTGTVSFVTKAEKEVSGPSITIIDPVFTSFTPASTKPKTDITIDGSNLDVVAEVIFEGSISGTIINQSESQITVTVPVGAKTGKITLKAINGTEVQSSSDITVTANLPTMTGFKEKGGKPGQILTLKGSDLLLIKEMVFPGNITATAYGAKNDSILEVYVPDNIETGYGTIGIYTYEGDEGITPQVFFGPIDPVYDQTLCFFDFDTKGSWWGNAINSAPSDSTELSADGSTFWYINGMSGTGWWDGLFFRNGGDNFVTTGVDVNTWAVRFDVNILETITEGDLRIRFGNYYYHFKPWDGVAGGYKTDGWITVTCPLTGFVTDGGDVITDPAEGASEFGMVWSWGVSVKVHMCIDNIRFEPL